MQYRKDIAINPRPYEILDLSASNVPIYRRRVLRPPSPIALYAESDSKDSDSIDSSTSSTSEDSLQAAKRRRDAYFTRYAELEETINRLYSDDSDADSETEIDNNGVQTTISTTQTSGAQTATSTTQTNVPIVATPAAAELCPS